MDRSVEDELAIRTLVARYCQAIGERDDKAWAETWALDGAWLVMGRESRGREAVLAHYQSLVKNASWVVQVATDGIIEVTGDSATGRWQIQETIGLPNAPTLSHLGRYRDRYQRDPDGSWRFARREFSLVQSLARS